tara:strand:+ start:504 stop:1184 length:681 start_codon:yes stop_codon:yes gene_type:complete
MSKKTELDKQLESVKKESKQLDEKLDSILDLPKHSMAFKGLQDLESELVSLEKEKKNQVSKEKKLEKIDSVKLRNTSKQIKISDRLLSDLHLIEDSINKYFEIIVKVMKLKKETNPEIVVPKTKAEKIALVEGPIRESLKAQFSNVADWDSFESIDAILAHIDEKRKSLTTELQGVVDDLKSTNQDWYKERGFSGLKLFCIKQNLVVDEYVKGKKFPEKKSKKKAI